MTSTEEILLAKYGAPLLKIEAVAEILGRRPASLRMLINGGNGDRELATKLRSCRVRLGNRVMFRLNELARMIDEA